ncbi:MAG: hypothetical protein SGPRY_010785 [Prymnesium sp.]
MLDGGVDPAECILHGEAAASRAAKRKPGDIVSAAELMHAWDNYKEMYGTNGMVAQGMHKRHHSDDEGGSCADDQSFGWASRQSSSSVNSGVVRTPSAEEERAENIRAAFSV